MWIVQNNFLEETQIQMMVDALNEFGAEIVTLGIVPFTHEFKENVEITRTDVVPYGSTTLMKIAEARGWTGLFFDRNTFRVDRWINERSDMLNSDAMTLEVADAMKFFETFSFYDDQEWFIRPVEDLKQFNGTLTVGKEIKRWMSSVESGNFSFDKHTLVSIAHPKNILAEWRYFVVDRKIISGSSYRMRGLRLTSREIDQDVLDEAQKLADRWLPHETCVMDLALTDDGLKVVEFNCLNASGFYYHDVRAIVRAVNAYFNSK